MTSAVAGFGGRHPVASVLAAVDGVLDGAVGAPLWSLSDDRVASLTAEAARLEARLAAVKLALVAEADSRGLAQRVGATSTQAWLRGVTRCAPGAAKREVVLARSLAGDLPVTRDALAAGDVSAAQARVIAGAVKELPVEATGPAAARPLAAVGDTAAAAAGGGVAADDGPAEDMPGDGGTVGGGHSAGAAVGAGGVGVRAEAERALVGHAARFDPTLLAKLGQRILDHVDPANAEQAEAKRLAELERRAFRTRELTFADAGDGVVWIRGRADTESAAVLRRALDPLAKPRPTDSDGPDNRTPGARMLDALVETCHRALHTADLPAQGGERPQLVITMDHDQLVERTGAGRLDTGEALSPATVRRIARDAQILPAVLGGESMPLDLGRTVRLFTPAQRRALTARDRGCAFPGCDRPPAWTQAHHVAHWIHGGASDLANGVLLCGHHHRLIHAGRWKVRIAADGIPEFTPPAYVDPQQKPLRNHMHTHARQRRHQRHRRRRKRPPPPPG